MEDEKNILLPLLLGVVDDDSSVVDVDFGLAAVFRLNNNDANERSKYNMVTLHVWRVARFYLQSYD